MKDGRRRPHAAILSTLVIVCSGFLAAQVPETVRALPSPASPLPAENDSRAISRFSFIVYGDTRGRHDGLYIQPDHLMVVEGILDTIKRLKTTPYPVRFVLLSGDGVVDGRQPAQWNNSFVDVATRLIKDGNVPFFMTPGNHDVTGGATVDAPGRAEGLKNFLALNQNLIPQEGSSRRL